MNEQRPHIKIRCGQLADAPQIAAILVAGQETFRGIWAETILLDLIAAKAEKRHELSSDGGGLTCTFVAEEPSGNLIGYARGGPWRQGSSLYVGELYELFVLPGWHHQGVGTRLFAQVVSFLISKEKKKIRVWTTYGIAAVGYYKRLGGKFLMKKAKTAGGVSWVMECYTWPSLTKLQNFLRLRLAP
jgi:GNAT superfamily N-acetyltransferase